MIASQQINTDGEKNCTAAALNRCRTKNKARQIGYAGAHRMLIRKKHKEPIVNREAGN